MRTSRGLVRDAASGALSVADLAHIHARPLARDEVRIEVAYAGICRTDLLVAKGDIASGIRASGTHVLGHECAGKIVAVGRDVALDPGARVTVDPRLPSGTFLGVSADGAFADHLVVPASVVHLVPEKLSLKVAAYTEPVAATLSILRVPLSKHARGVIAGSGRIAELTLQVLRACGFEAVEIRDWNALDCEYDFAIETGVTTETWSRLVRSVKRGGTLVLKSRTMTPVSFNLAELVPTEITISCAHYGSFPEAIALLDSGRIDVDAVFGETFPLERFEAAFHAGGARSKEAKKVFFALGTE